MTKTMLEELLATVKQVTETARRARASARAPEISATTVRQLRGWTKLSQPEFAGLLGVELSTLRNWEQGRREPTGPARALLRAIRNDPENVIRALERGGARGAGTRGAGTRGAGARGAGRRHRSRPPLRRREAAA